MLRRMTLIVIGLFFSLIVSVFPPAVLAQDNTLVERVSENNAYAYFYGNDGSCTTRGNVSMTDNITSHPEPGGTRTTISALRVELEQVCNGQLVYSILYTAPLDRRDSHVDDALTQASLDTVVSALNTVCGCMVSVDIDLHWIGGELREQRTNFRYEDPNTGTRIFAREVHYTSPTQLAGTIAINGVTVIQGYDAYDSYINSHKGHITYVHL
jgi:hypothetical protein